jgi:hypothetical protein
MEPERWKKIEQLYQSSVALESSSREKYPEEVRTPALQAGLLPGG